MTFWRGGAGSRIDRTYVSDSLVHLVEKVYTKMWVASDHLAVITILTACGARKRKYSRCFIANREIMDSPEGIRRVR